MADFSKYPKKMVIIITLVGAVVICTLIGACIFASLHCELLNLSVGGFVVAAFAIMPYYILGGLYGYFVSLLAFLIVFINALVLDSDNIYKMSINLAAIICFSLFGQYRWFATKTKTAISALVTLFITAYMQFFTIIVVIKFGFRFVISEFQIKFKLINTRFFIRV